MNRYDQAFLYELAAGDRFYFSNDKKKEVWTLHEHKQKRNFYGATISVVFMPEVKYSEKRVNSARVVIFLRHAQ